VWGAAAIFFSGAACGPADDDDGMGSSTTVGSGQIKYGCDCEGNGLYTQIEVCGSSHSSATSLANAQCQNDYPDQDCSCSCYQIGSCGGSSEGSGGCPPKAGMHFCQVCGDVCEYCPNGTMCTPCGSSSCG
jgi:hypothetical protein